MCQLHGDDTPIQMDEQEIPLVIVKEFEKMGNLSNTPNDFSSQYLNLQPNNITYRHDHLVLNILGPQVSKHQFIKSMVHDPTLVVTFGNPNPSGEAMR